MTARVSASELAPSSTRYTWSVPRVAAAIAALMVFIAVPPPAAEADPPAANVIPLTMRSPRGGFNRMVVSVTLCEPGTDRCATIDDVMVDTGSTGLRIEASAMPSSLRLPPLSGPNGAPLAECLRFVHDAAWGPLVRADLQLGGLKAADVTLQVITDGPDRQPDGCPPSTVRPTSNGTLGIGQHLFDCQGSCEQAAVPDVFSWVGGAWLPFQGAVGERYRVPNPVSRLAVHNDGIVIELPAPANGHENQVTGTLTFGVGTAPDNGLDGARVVHMDRRGFFTTLYRDTAYPESYLDSGTMTYILTDGSLPHCNRLQWAYCVAPTRRLSAMIVGREDEAAPVSLNVGDYEATVRAGFGASDDIASAADAGTKSFVWGAPFFLGRRIFLVMDGKGVPGHPELAGPFLAIR